MSSKKEEISVLFKIQQYVLKVIVQKYFLKILFIYLFIYLFLERGREGEREGENYQCVVASHTAPTGDLACNPGMCPRLGIEPVTL